MVILRTDPPLKLWAVFCGSNKDYYQLDKPTGMTEYDENSMDTRNLLRSSNVFFFVDLLKNSLKSEANRDAAAQRIEQITSNLTK